MIRYRLVFFLCLMAGPVWAQPDANPPAPGFNAAASDAEAIALADATMQAMGGRAAWNRTRYLSWTIFGQHHVWDRWTGHFRHERDSTLTLMNVHTQEGRVWIDGTEVQIDSTRAKILADTYARWINNSYWLIMPYKLKDSGVTLKYVGPGTTEAGTPADIVHLTFENVGLTPQNKYAVYIDRETKLVTQWAFYPTADDAEPRFVLPWTDWEPYGQIKLSSGRGGEHRVIHIRVHDIVPAAVFENPAPTAYFGDE